MANKYPSDTQKFTVLYDIACTFHSHVNRNNTPLNQLKDKFKFAVSVFHAYGHTPQCQIKYHPRYMDDLGLTDGECLERLWSNLRYFIPITRYMRPNHRLDVLDSVLYCISNNMIDNLGLYKIIF